MVSDSEFDEIGCREISWTFRIPRDDLWSAVEVGIAIIGQTYTAQHQKATGRIGRPPGVSEQSRTAVHARATRLPASPSPCATVPIRDGRPQR